MLLRKKMGDLAGAMDAVATRLAHLATTLLFWPALYAVTAGTAVFIARHTSWMKQIETNKVPLKESVLMVKWTGGAFLVIIAAYAAVLLVRRLRTGSSGGLGTWVDINRRLRPLVALPVVPALFQANIERDSPRETFFYILLAAAACGAGAYAWMRTPAHDDGLDAPPPPRVWRERLMKALAALGVSGLWAGYGWFFSWLSILNHHALNTRTTDLGYYDNIFWNSSHGKPLGCSFIKMGYHGSAHFDPILVLISPVYRLYPRAEMILALQSVWLGAGVVPMYLLAHHKLGRRLPALALAAMYALYPALQGANMYEFHSLSLLTPVALTALYLLEIGAYRRYFVALVLALLVREDVSLLMCFVGLYAILTRREKMVRTGWATIFLSLTYFGVVKRFFMTSADIFMNGPNSYSFAYYYDDLIPNHNSAAGLIVSLVTNPMFVVHTIVAEAKIHYLLVLFVPLLFLPFVARPGRVMLLYGMIFCLLASRGAVFSPHFQYSSVIIPVAFALVPQALRQIEEGPAAPALGLDAARFSRALLVAAFVASLGVSWKFGGIIDNQQFRGGFVRVARSLPEKDRQLYAWIREQTDKIPVTASVATTNRVGAYVSNRRAAFFYPEHVDVDYLFIDEAELRGPDVDRHNKNVAAGAYQLIARREKIAFYKRQPGRPVR